MAGSMDIGEKQSEVAMRTIFPMWLHLLLAIPAVALTVAGAAAGQGRAADIGMGEEAAPGNQKYLELRLDPARGTLEGMMRVTPPAGSGEFRLLESLNLNAVHQDGRELELTQLDDGRYRVRASPDGGPLVMAWSGSLPQSVRDGAYLSEDSGFLPPRGGWYPGFETDEPFRLTLVARVPAGQKLVATGSLDGDGRSGGAGAVSDGAGTLADSLAGVSEGQPGEEQDFYQARYTHPRVDGVTLATGPWQERSVMVDGVRVRTLFPRGLDAEHGPTYLEYAGTYLRGFVARIGPYPYKSFTVAATAAPIGVAFPGFTLLGERVIPLPFIPRTSLAHELLHNWWGVGVRVDHASGNWSEALTTYMADYWLDEQRGDGRKTRQRWLLDLSVLPAERDRPLSAFRGGNQGADRIIGYNKGAQFFHMLRQRIGDDAFDAGVSLFSRRQLFQRAAWSDLEAAFSEAAGQELSGYFRAWVSRAGLPELRLNKVVSRADGEGWVVSGELEQMQEQAPWPLDVPLVLETAEGSSRHLIVLDQRRTAFRLHVDQRPLLLRADPDYDVLRRLQDPPPILRTVVLDTDTRMLRVSDGLDGLDQALLGREAGEAGMFTPDRPLLLAGTTADVARWLRDNVPEAASGTGPGAGEDGSSATSRSSGPALAMAEQGHARMWTVPGTRLVVVSADDPKGLRNLVGALRHHGHRSYLVQDANGAVVDAGSWDLEEEDMQVVPKAVGN